MKKIISLGDVDNCLYVSVIVLLLLQIACQIVSIILWFSHEILFQVWLSFAGYKCTICYSRSWALYLLIPNW